MGLWHPRPQDVSEAGETGHLATACARLSFVEEAVSVAAMGVFFFLCVGPLHCPWPPWVYVYIIIYIYNI